MSEKRIQIINSCADCGHRVALDNVLERVKMLEDAIEGWRTVTVGLKAEQTKSTSLALALQESERKVLQLEADNARLRDNLEYYSDEDEMLQNILS